MLPGVKVQQYNQDMQVLEECKKRHYVSIEILGMMVARLQFYWSHVDTIMTTTRLSIELFECRWSDVLNNFELVQNNRLFFT